MCRLSPPPEFADPGAEAIYPYHEDIADLLALIDCADWEIDEDYSDPGHTSAWCVKGEAPDGHVFYVTHRLPYEDELLDPEWEVERHEALIAEEGCLPYVGGGPFIVGANWFVAVYPPAEDEATHEARIAVAVETMASTGGGLVRGVPCFPRGARRLRGPRR